MKELTRRSVEEAMGNRAHPLIDVLTLHQPHIQQLNSLLSPNTLYADQHIFAKKTWGSLIADIAQIPRISLTPLDIIAVWSKVMDVLPRHLYLRYDFATIIAGYYAVQGLEKQYKNIPSHFMQTDELPANVQNDKDALFHLRKRLGRISRSAQAIDNYRDAYIHRKKTAKFLVATCENMETGRVVLFNAISLAEYKEKGT